MKTKSHLACATFLREKSGTNLAELFIFFISRLKKAAKYADQTDLETIAANEWTHVKEQFYRRHIPHEPPAASPQNKQDREIEHCDSELTSLATGTDDDL
jgi:hypothetical protein